MKGLILDVGVWSALPALVRDNEKAAVEESTLSSEPSGGAPSSSLVAPESSKEPAGIEKGCEELVMATAAGEDKDEEDKKKKKKKKKKPSEDEKKPKGPSKGALSKIKKMQAALEEEKKRREEEALRAQKEEEERERLREEKVGRTPHYWKEVDSWSLVNSGKTRTWEEGKAEAEGKRNGG